MIAAIKAEFTKLLTVRSTYFLTLLVCAIVVLISFYAIGLRQPEAFLQDPGRIKSTIYGEMQFVGGIAAIISVLLMAHEYRYNTINYSFTISNSRSKVLASKFIAATVYAVVLGAISLVLGVVSLYAGAAVAGHVVGPQTYSFMQLYGQSLFYVWGMAMVGLIITILLRNLVASIAFIFVFPSVEQLLALLLKGNSGYLPFTALSKVTPIIQQGTSDNFSVSKSVTIFACYLVVLGAIAWLATLKKDAS